MALRQILEGAQRGPQEEHWIPLSDLMTGLMMIFLVIAILFMAHTENDAEKAKIQAAKVEAQAIEANRQADVIKSIALIYDKMRAQLYNALAKEFENDLPAWRAVLLKDLTIRFQEPDVLFDSGKNLIKPAFAAVLDDFFPRYVKILSSKQFRDAVEEIRIEGHTSSHWKTTPERAYFENMQLSQARTRSVLEYVLMLPNVSPDQTWLRGRLTANGLSSSRLILRDGREDSQASQRVEFRVRTNSEEQIGEIVRAVPR